MKFYKLIFFFFFIVIFLIGCFTNSSIAEKVQLNAPDNLVSWQSGKYIQIRYDFDCKEQYEYNVYRSPNLNGEWEKLNFIPFPLNTFVDYNPFVYETSHYKVVRIDYQGNEGIPAIIKVQYDITKISIRREISLDKNDIISDQQLINFSSMSLWDIQSFLSDHGSYLATFSFNGRSAAQHIYDACQEHQINPQVVLATLQKEQGLITSSTTTQGQLNWAMGWNGSSDFGTQIYWGTKQFRRYYDNLESYGWSVGEPHTVYDGVVTPANIATAGLYIYTPWIGEGGGGQYGVGGNYLFWDLWYNIFNFGSSIIELPTVETKPATSVEQTAAFLNGKIVDDGGSSIIERRFDWGITPSGTDWTDWTENVGVSGNYFSYYLTGLEPDTTYYFRAWAKNSVGWSHGDILSFKTLVDSDTIPPLVNMFFVAPDSVILDNSFNISYTVSDNVGLKQAELWRANDVGGTPDWPSEPIQIISLSGQKNYSGSFTDVPDALGTYWYGMHVVDNAGNWSCEPDPPGPIKVTVVSLTRIIRLEGNLNFGDVQVGSSSQRTLTIYNDGNSILTVDNISCPTGFTGNWSGNISAGGSTNVTITFSPTQVITYGGTLTVDSDKTSGTNTKSVSGTGVQLTSSPQVTTNNASGVTTTSTQLSGNLDSTGGLTCQVWFEYGKTTSYGSPTTKVSKSTTGSFNRTISALDPNTTYHFRAKASNTEGSDNGLDKSFRTLANVPGSAAFSPVTATSIQANWTANGNPSGTQYYCENTTKGTNSNWITSTSWNSTGLSANTTYHFQVKTRNEDGVETNWTDLSSQKTPILGDFGSANNGPPDYVVDFEDLMIFALAYGSTPSDSNWNPVCDIASPGGLIPDGVIDFEDLMIFAMHYGETYADM